MDDRNVILRIVAATKHNQLGFLRNTLLGRALARVAFRPGLQLDVTVDNTAGLPEVFNAALSRAQDSDYIVFTHDDVWFDDWFLYERLVDSLKRFDVVGVAGNRRRVAKQPAWYCTDSSFKWDAQENLSGAVAHIEGFSERVSYYGASPSPVKLLDGVFLASKAKLLRSKNVAFDPQFRFHCYDMDFCRTCEQAGLKMGTWPIAITHASGGLFGTPEWQHEYAKYLAKWKE
jgi:GT2 family glycosyltransferase